MNDKVHLDHEHVRHLLTAMLRIRRFEEKCFELYQTRRSVASCISTTARRRSRSA